MPERPDPETTQVFADIQSENAPPLVAKRMEGFALIEWTRRKCLPNMTRDKITETLDRGVMTYVFLLMVYGTLSLSNEVVREIVPHMMKVFGSYFSLKQSLGVFSKFFFDSRQNAQLALSRSAQSCTPAICQKKRTGERAAGRGERDG